MKLRDSPGARSLSPHVALHEAGLPFQAVLGSTKSHKPLDRAAEAQGQSG